MAGAAPYIASPLRRLLGGTIDFSLCMFVGLMLGVSLGSSDTGPVEAALRNEHMFILYAAYHAACFGLFQGQTPGQSLFDVRVVRSSDGGALSLTQALVRGTVRPVALYLWGWAAVYASPVPDMAAAAVAAPLLAELGMMFTLPTRQTLADLASRSFVVNVPPPQPHRAPAAPMYSATDAEFGVRPRRK